MLEEAPRHFYIPAILIDQFFQPIMLSIHLPSISTFSFPIIFYSTKSFNPFLPNFFYNNFYSTHLHPAFPSTSSTHPHPTRTPISTQPTPHLPHPPLPLIHSGGRVGSDPTLHGDQSPFSHLQRFSSMRLYQGFRCKWGWGNGGGGMVGGRMVGGRIVVVEWWW